MATTFQIFITFLYPKTSKFDLSYYLSHHIPATKAAWEPLGLTSCIVAQVEGGDYVLKVIIGFKDLASWEEAKGGEGAKELSEDVKNFTDSTPVVIVGEVVSS
jgi:uncharacterized protein (TIGR02118 family)